MSTDTAAPAQQFYKLEAAVDQLPEQYPSLPQKTQLQEYKRKKCILEINTQAVIYTVILLNRSFTFSCEDK
jgi:hypothetical protein